MLSVRSTRSPEGRLRTALAVTGLALWPFVYFWRATLGTVALLPHDGYRYAFPLKLLTARLIAAGELPLWNSYMYSGFPLFAAMQAGALLPGTWLFWVLPPVAAANLQMMLTYSVAAVGTYAYTRQIGCTAFAAVFGGCTFAFGGFMVAHLGNMVTPQVAATLPWLLWVLESLRTEARLGTVALGAALVALALYTGYPPVQMSVLLVAGLYTASAGLIGRPPVGRARYLLACASVVAIGLLLAAAQLLPTAELGAQSVRAHMSFEEFTDYSLPLLQLPMLLFPFLFGDQSPTPYWGAWNIWELSGYVGVAPCMLAAAALSLVRRNRLAAFWSAFACFALLLMLGPGTPLASLMYRVPGYNLFRAQARNVLEFDFALAVLSALALTAASRRALVAGAMAIASLVAATACVAETLGERIWAPLAIAGSGEAVGRRLAAELTAANPAVWLPVAIAAAVGAVLVAVARRPSAARCALLLALQLGDSWYFGDVLSRQYPGPAWLLAPPDVVEAVRGLPVDPSSARVAIVKRDQDATDLRSALWGVPLVNGYDPFMLTRYAQFVGGMGYWGSIAPAAAFRQPLYLDLLNARWVVLIHPALESALGGSDDPRADPSRWTARRTTEGYTVFENLLARPRAWLVGRTVRAVADDALRTVRAGRFADGQAFDASRVAVVEDGPGREYGDVGSSAGVAVVSYRPNAIELITRAGAPAFLVVSEIDYPGWRAYVDGVAVPITRTDYVLRGLEVGAGEHRVRMVFAPRSALVGLAVSALTAGALIAAVVVRRRGAPDA